MRKKISRILAFTLASALMLSSLSLNALATEANEPQIAEELQIEAETEEMTTETETEIAADDEVIAETEAEEAETPADDEETIALPEEETEAAETEEAEAEPLEEEAAEALAVSVDSLLTAKDSFGNTYKVFTKSATTGVLFLSGDIKLSDLKVTASAEVKKASAGTLGADHVLSGAFKKSGDKVTLTASDNKTYTITVMQSTLPTLHLTLKDVTLAEINAGSKETKYKGNSLTLYDPSGSNVTAKKVQIKGRGNSTWSNSVKKPYQIKFNEATSVLGMEPAEKWILLANAFDDTLLRNAVGFTLAKQLGMACAPDFRFIDLFVDGNYIGNYMICEKCEIGPGRVNMTSDEAVLAEFDQVFYKQEPFWINSPKANVYFTLKESNTEGNEPELLSKFSAKLDRLMNFMQTTAPDQITLADISKYIDLASVAQYALTTEYTYNLESWQTSFYWYSDGPSDVLHFGPVWDFDSGLANYMDFSGVSDICKNSYAYYQMLINIPVVSDYIQSYYNRYKSVFSGAASIANKYGAQLTSSAAMNYTRWEFLGKPNTKPGHRAFHNTYGEAVNFLANWLTARANAYKPDLPVYVNVKNGYINVVWKTTAYSSAKFAIWSKIGEQDDLNWAYMTRMANGYWTASLPLSAFKHSGEFVIHLFGDGRLTNHTTIVVGNYQSVILTQNSWMADLNIAVAQNYSQIRAAVWSQENSQDDLKWYDAARQPDGNWKLSVDLSGHTGKGIYHFHVYGVINGKSALIATKSLNVSDKSLATYNGVDYSPVYNYDYYMSHHADLKRAYSNKPAGAAKHFFTFGMKEGRQASEKFAVAYYRDNYADLKKAYGDSLYKYYNHYVIFGAKEGREAKYLIPVSGGLNYSAVYNYDYYINRYADLKKAFGSDQYKAFQHFLKSGMKEGRQGSENFNCSIYKSRYADLKKAFGDKNDLYYKHYIQFGMKEGRKAI